MPEEIAPEDLRTWLKPRPSDCHKGGFGNVGILGGDTGMTGAALLAGRAALWLGAGRVYCGLLDIRIAVDPVSPELMLTTPEQILALAEPACLVVGPGLGQSNSARDWLAAALATPHALLLDADALNLVAGNSRLTEAVRARTAPTLLTPHPGEAARLLGIGTSDIQGDRSTAVGELVARYRCGVVLKGAGSLIQFTEGEVWRNRNGNPGMAAPGMGDVLSGMIAALAAQGLSLERAAVAGVYLHGAAGDAAVSQGSGPIGLTASEVALAARRQLNALIYGVS